MHLTASSIRPSKGPLLGSIGVGRGSADPSLLSQLALDNAI